MVRFTKENEVKIVKYLRYRKDNPSTTNKTYMKLDSIARFINRSYSYVYRICMDLEKPKEKKEEVVKDVGEK